MARIALALPLSDEDRLGIDLVRHGHELAGRCSSADELAALLATGRADYAVVAATARYLNDRLIVEADAAGVRIIALVAQESERRHAAELGLHETADAASEWSQLELMLLGSPAFTAPAAVDPTRGTVIAVWGPAGSPGRTTLSIAIAAELAAAGHTVALADVDTHSGSIAPAIGLLDEAPGFAAACRLAGSDSLNRAELERIGQRYATARGGFWVLTGIGRPSRWPELSAERVSRVIAECRTWVDYTVLDTGASLENDEEISSDLFAPRRNAATLTALADADRVIAVGSADPVGLSRFLRAHVDLVEVVDSERVAVVMNRVRASAIGLDAAAQVRQTLLRFGGIAAPVLIPHDQAAVDAAVLSGKTLADVAPRSPARLAVAGLVAERILPPVAIERRQGRRARTRVARTQFRRA
ncbi:AAA family ATPase [Lacisediminihabitans changchengi]|uniref:Regulator n=1 Tax=Lacisediminihabitans changchengi TaxID=2787634 RepID=A0A934W225_9MICO|nr:regulator [Lacisediminihabitans changchengi]MBK4346396.1 regulator [Lacisediminihabitans changchengi]